MTKGFNVKTWCTLVGFALTVFLTACNCGSEEDGHDPADAAHAAMRKFSLPTGQIVGRSCWLESAMPRDEICLVAVRLSREPYPIVSMVVRCTDDKYCHAAAILSLEGTPLPEALAKTLPAEDDHVALKVEPDAATHAEAPLDAGPEPDARKPKPIEAAPFAYGGGEDD